MADIEPILAFDGDDYQIIYSADFNVYENKLILRKVAGYEFIFEFIKDPEKKDVPMGIHGDDINKIVNIKFYNFDSVLGTGSTKKIPVLKMAGGKQVFFSIHTKSLNESTSFLKVSLTFYLK